MICALLLPGCATTGGDATAASSANSGAVRTTPVDAWPAPSGAPESTAFAQPVAARPGAALDDPTAGMPQPSEYRIGPQDLLEVQVFEVAELSGKARVTSNGYVALPLIGQVAAAGLTGAELSARIAAELAKDYLQDPHVSVFILEHASQRVTVMGAVNRPGVYPLQGPTTLVQAVALAGGLHKLSDPNDIKLVRVVEDGLKRERRYDLAAIRSGQQPDPYLEGGDAVIVSKSAGKAIAQDVIDFVLPFRYLGTLVAPVP
jgi:polysaccharide export outer membrane protein